MASLVCVTELLGKLKNKEAGFIQVLNMQF